MNFENWVSMKSQGKLDFLYQLICLVSFSSFRNIIRFLRLNWLLLTCVFQIEPFLNEFTCIIYWGGNHKIVSRINCFSCWYGKYWKEPHEKTTYGLPWQFKPLKSVQKIAFTCRKKKTKQILNWCKIGLQNQNRTLVFWWKYNFSV